MYEGDLYKYTLSHDMYDPESSGHTSFEVEHIKAVTFENGAFYHGADLLSDVVEYDDTLKYVGNIYENPELLEELQNGTK
ncbi:YopX family protein [Lysinibacillus sp. G4S2]|uniref:YopX family protein n=1 Tax=Lysinibacillus sp. G4S2 TaxID=3055859 RepID=UPI0025A1C9FE|nr:YopX family protein [Lysinibacillus sp. G4S2]MDM5245741.1 YopX family protein [Lysinibacillus sp. G4S2]